MTTTTTTTTRTLAGQIEAAVGAYARMSNPRARLSEQLGACMRRAVAQPVVEEGDLPYGCYTAAYGVAYAIETGRLAGSVELAIRALSTKKLARLLAEVAEACPTIGDVPRWLNARFPG